MYISEKLKVEPKGNQKEYSSYDWDGTKAEARWMRTILPRTMSKFTRKYKGTHFQNLPPELLQAIAVQCNVAAMPGMYGLHITQALGKYRELCRATSEAGKAVVLSDARRRRRPRGPRKLRIPDCKRTMEQTLSVFKDTGLGTVVKEIHFDIMPVFPPTNQELLLIEYFRAKGLTRQKASQRATAVLEELQTAVTHQDNFFETSRTHAGFEKITDILDCMPNLEQLQIQMLNFWTFARNSLSFGALICNNAALSATELSHWKLLPQFFDLIERYSIKKLRLEADSSLFGIEEVLATRLFGASRRSPRRLTTMSPARLSQSCQTLTHIDLAMTYMDYACLGHYDDIDEYGGMTNELGFRALLAGAVNLDSLHLSFSVDHGGLNDNRRIDHRWLHEVLREQYWPKLKHFNLWKVEADPEQLIKIMRAHKQSLTAVVLCSILCPHASGMVKMLHFMREELCLKRCEVTEFEFIEDDDTGELALEQICEEYKANKAMKEYEDYDNDSGDEEDDESSDECPDLNEIDLGLWILHRDTQGRLVDDGQALREYRENDNSEEDFN